jgi:hypothetical protein
MIYSGASDDSSNSSRAGANYLEWPTRLDAVRVRVPIRCVFVWIVTESETYHIYKTVLQTIKAVVRTPLRVLELVVTKDIFNKARLDIGLLLSKGSKPV